MFYTKHKMDYTKSATPRTPALIIYLVGASYFKNEPLDESTKIPTKILTAHSILQSSINEMIRRSMHNGIMEPCYKIAIFSYSTEVHATKTKVEDLSGGIRALPDLLKSGIRAINAHGEADTTAGFKEVESLLQNQLEQFQGSPAPLVCHLTDGRMPPHNDPYPVIKRIQAMHVNDGHVLVENVYVGNDAFDPPISGWHRWPGITREAQLKSKYAEQLFLCSSRLPETYRRNINMYGHALKEGAVFFFPGTHTKFARLAFSISEGTQH